ncbi:hypothetical protein A1O1_04801 [Capronia coronata CBS 617.96]|uniref:chitin deacetylase n=1 Tax=Capronia coronata CBS 617.96 TaxID=1182541 RepID=W9Z032_9EURO|nr:uncharacterized protein A1O1_04801 [Capronia coronata CBS 617.96]EXJ87874.1 hypothetical protein A1O1_04801 [Capronia coronata CBS 617.96]
MPLSSPLILSCLFSFFLILLLSFLWIIYKPPLWLITHLQHRWPDVLFHVPPKPNKNQTQKQILIALTIDDGPSENTPEIQALLNTHGAKATFFLIGCHIPAHKETLRQLVVNGHELANHAMHDEPSYSLSLAELTRQIQSVERQLEQVYQATAVTTAVTTSTASTASSSVQPNHPSSIQIRTTPTPTRPYQHSKPPKYFRPGSGFFNTSMRKLTADLHNRIVLGSIYPHDAQISSWRLNAWHILSMARAGGIIVCHDRPWTAPMLRAVLPELKRRGYRVVTVTELLNGYLDT